MASADVSEAFRNSTAAASEALAGRASAGKASAGEASAGETCLQADAQSAIEITRETKGSAHVGSGAVRSVNQRVPPDWRDAMRGVSRSLHSA